MLYGATGYTGVLIAQRGLECGHRPVLAGRSAPAVSALGERLGLPHRVLSLDDPAALEGALADVDLVLNAAGPFLHTAAPLAQACLDAGVHYLDMSNELQVFLALYDLDEKAKQAGVSVIPGVGFGVVATNCLARYVSEAVGGAEHLEVASRVASAQPGPGAAATMQENLPYGGWIRQGGELTPRNLHRSHDHRLPRRTMRSDARSDRRSRSSLPRHRGSQRRCVRRQPSSPRCRSSPNGDSVPSASRSFGWARATGHDRSMAEAWLETGDSYAFTPAASIRAVEETLKGIAPGALSPAAAFGADFAFTIQDTTRIDALQADATLTASAG